LLYQLSYGGLWGEVILLDQSVNIDIVAGLDIAVEVALVKLTERPLGEFMFSEPCRRVNTFPCRFVLLL
jgi:hypothetical protein